MNNKAFFSAIILIFVLTIFIFFVTQKQENINLKFDDSSRYFALKTEEAYSLLDKNLSMLYFDLVQDNCDVGYISGNINNYLNNLNNTKLNEYCKVIYPELKTSQAIDPFTLNLSIGANIYCEYKSENKIYSYKLPQIFHKQYHAALSSGNCEIVLTDLDAKTVYYSN